MLQPGEYKIVANVLVEALSSYAAASEDGVTQEGSHAARL